MPGEITDEIYQVKFLYHIINNDNVMNNYSKIINGESIPISGREENKDFCIKCYNQIMTKSWNEVLKIKDKNKC